MAKVNVESELIFNHTDEEIVDFIDSLMTGIIKNYRTSLTTGRPEILWGNLGDISLVSGLVREIKKRNISRHDQSKMI